MVGYTARVTNQMNQPGSVVFKGYKHGLTLIIPEIGPFEKYLDELRNKLEQAQDFFKGAKISVKTGKRVLNEPENVALNQILSDSGLTLNRIIDDVDLWVHIKKNESLDETDEFIGTITVKKTVRSGQRVEFEGNLVIAGDVNPGAEIAASGDIIVLGTLRGTAHAGAAGDQNARIIAFHFDPVQIRIAGVINRAPDPKKRINMGRHSPEAARIKDGFIVVERIDL